MYKTVVIGYTPKAADMAQKIEEKAKNAERRLYACLLFRDGGGKRDIGVQKVSRPSFSRKEPLQSSGSFCNTFHHSDGKGSL